MESAGEGGGVSCFSHSAMQRVSLHPPPAVNQSQCLFNYWDQRGPFTSSSSLSLVQSLVFSPPPPFSISPYIPPCSLAAPFVLTVQFHFYGLEHLL